MSPPSAPPPPVKGGSSLDVPAGTRLGKYEILKRIATGGMAEIFLARVSGLPGFQKMVVIKRILPQLATKADFIEMFLDEARIAATLQHPNVVQMYDVGVVDGNYFIAMEYLHGEDVRSIMKTLARKEDKLPLEHALNVVIGVCSGLHYAHEKVGFDGKPLNIIHRDVTPQNIIVTFEGGVKLLDFGIAKASNRFGETRFGTLKGKVPYMSPEQCRGETLDRRSDIFSLGIMLYELSLGRRLYRGASDFEVLKQIVEGSVKLPHEYDPGYNPALEKIVMRALEKERDKRYQTAREMQADLEGLVREERLYVSPIALGQFMEQTFGQKIEAWREAQAKGQSLEQLVEEVPAQEVDEEDVEEMSEEQAKSEEESRKQRDALRAAIHLPGLDEDATRQHTPSSLSQPGRPPSGTDASSLEALRAPRSKLYWLVGSGVVLGLVAAVGIKLTMKAHPVEKPALAVAESPPAPEPKPVVTELPSPPPAEVKPEAAPTAAKPVEPAPIAAAPKAHAAAHHSAHHDSRAKPAASAPTPAPVAAKPEPAPAKAEAPPPAAPLTGDGTLVIASSPWCNVSIDGVDRGPTPVSMKLPAGKHAVVLTNPEFKINRSQSVMVMPNETVRKKFDFAQ